MQKIRKFTFFTNYKVKVSNISLNRDNMVSETSCVHSKREAQTLIYVND